MQEHRPGLRGGYLLSFQLSYFLVVRQFTVTG